jgi:hypothetical protein
LPRCQSRRARVLSSFTLADDGLRLLRRNPKVRRIVVAGVLTEPFPYSLLFLYQR